MHILSSDTTEQVVALYHIRQSIRTDTNAVVGTVTHGAMLNGHIHIAQGFGDIQNVHSW